MKNEVISEARKVIENGAFCYCGEQLSLSAEVDYHETHLKKNGTILAGYSIWCNCGEWVEVIEGRSDGRTITMEIECDTIGE